MSLDDIRARTQLKQCIENEYEALLRQMRLYVLNWHLAGNDTALAMSEELLQEVTREALQNAHRFDPERSPIAWINGIMLNIIQRERKAQAQHYQREIHFRDLIPDKQTTLSDDEIFDRYLRPHEDDTLLEAQSEEEFKRLISVVSESEQIILRLKYFEGLKIKIIANVLDITPDAVKQRLSRARQRLRGIHGQNAKVDRT